MVLQLYDDAGVRIGAINAVKPKIEATLSDGAKTLTFDYPKDAPFAERLRCEYGIRTPDDNYIIKDFESSTDKKKISIGCRLDRDGLEGKMWASFKTTAKTAAECMATALDGTGWSAVIYGDVTRRRTVKKDSACNAVDVIERACKVYGLEPEYDTKERIVKLHASRGRDRGAYLCEALNLRKLRVQSSSYDFYTRIVPIGKDGIGIDIDGKNYVENYSYSRKVKTYVWKDERYTHPESLIEDAERKLEEMCRPYEVYEVDMTDLAAADAERYGEIPDFELGDTVSLISSSERVRAKYRVAATIEYPDETHRNSCQLANGKLTFAQLQEQNDEEVIDEAVGAASEIVGETKSEIKTELSDSVTATNELIANALGFYVTDITSGGVIRRYMHDMPTLGESSMIYTIKNGAFIWAPGWNSGKPQWQRGQSAEGNAILRQLALLKLSASCIKGGSLVNVPISCGSAFSVAADGTVTIKISGEDKSLAALLADIISRLDALDGGAS